MKLVKRSFEILAICWIVMCVCVAVAPVEVAHAANDDIYQKIEDLWGKKPQEAPLEQVYLGGYPLGLTLDGEGVTIVGLNEFVSSDGQIVCPALACGLQIGDVIVSIDDTKIYSSSMLVQIARKSQGRAVKMSFVRQGEKLCCEITPQKDFATGSFRLGLWTKDVSSGVGTLTYVKQDGTFGCLGHPIVDSKGKIVDASNGGVYKCVINDVAAGKRGQAGELHGSFDFDDKIGSIYLNNKFGVFGTLDEHPSELTLVDVLPRGKVKMGKASIYTTVDGVERHCFDVEIVKTCNQGAPDDKSMVLRVVDEELIAKTGGIVQGMSGSPIVQDGKLVGAVTHVFVNDPTKGYGIYAEWMLKN
ncbi:MAG: SpoIVB peptidase [Clostridia bacterium]|nr:SpoIVB peptidase [Clostridia bacterium]